MDLNLELSSSAEQAPTAIIDAWEQAASIIDSTFTNNITVNIEINWTGTGGGASAGPNGGEYVSYSTVYNYLTGHATPGDTTFAGLPNGSTIAGASEVAVWDAQLKAMGLMAANGTEIDGTANFATDISASLMVGVALHEFAHAMGRVPYSSNTPTSSLDPDLAQITAVDDPALFTPPSATAGTGGDPDIFDFYDYTSPGNLLINGSVPAPTNGYFSIDGGTQSAEWGVYGSQSDPSDFLNAYAYDGDPSSNLSPEDAFNQFYDNSTNQFLTPLDIEQMIAIGFDVAPGLDPAMQQAADFNGDNSEDILLQSTSGNIIYADMAAGTFQNYVEIADTPGYSVVGNGKISGGADADVVLQNSSGTIVYANMAGGAFSDFVNVATTPGFKVVGVGNISDSSYDDIVIQNSSGQIVYANMNGGVFNNWQSVATTPGYTVMGVGDILGNGYADIVVENSSGSIAFANMTDGVFGGWLGIPSAPDWTVVGVGDVARTGYADVVIEDESTGQIAYANMDGGTFQNWVYVASAPGWNVIGVEDVIGNGFDDIVVENTSTGQIVYANMTGGTFQGWVGVGAAAGYVGHTAPAGVAATTVTATVAAQSSTFNSGAASSLASETGLFASSAASSAPSQTSMEPAASLANILHSGVTGA